MAFDELRSLAARLESDIARGPIVPQVTPEEIRGYLASRYDFTKPAALDDICADLERMLRTWQVQVTHPRYFGLFNPSVTVASIVADTLVAMYNPQLAAWRTSPAANEIERHTLQWLAGKFGLPATAACTFTSGGAESNLSAVIVALTRAFPDYGEGGLRRLDRSPTIYLSGQSHHSFNKIAHMTGLGRRAIRTVATDSELKMDLADLARQVAEDRKSGLAPFMVVGTVGTTAAGAIDRVPELAAFCRSEDLWFHVDAAWGGAAVLSPRLRGYLAGIEAADSITCDAHKWFSVPMGAGMFFCRHPGAVGEAFHAETSYMPAKTDGPVLDPYVTSAQWSRRFIGLKLFLALAQQGESGYVEMIEHQAHMGDVLRESLTRAGWRIVNATPLPLVCFTRDGLVTSTFLAALYERQIAWMSEVRLGDGPPVLRACITSFRTTEADIEWVVGEMSQRIVRQMRRETIAIHGGYHTDPTTKSVAVPIYQTAAYEFDSADHAAALFNLEVEGFRYTRINNPTTDVLERRVAALEGGVAALCVASGQAAVNYAALNLVEIGSNLISVPQLYGTTHTLFAHVLPNQGVTVRFAESDRADAIEALIDDNTRAVFCESVGNPAGNVCDVEALARVAHKHGIPLIVDNTVATPILLRPIEYGADIVVHSLTKFMGGHGTTLGGAIVDSGRFPWKEHAQRFPAFSRPDPSYHNLVYTDHFKEAAFIGRCRSVYQRTTGAVLSPLSAFLLLQGIETVALRVERHVANGKAVAEYLRKDRRVEWVNYAGFPDSPHHACAQKYLGGRACSLMTFGIKGGFEASKKFYDALGLIKRLVNLGDAKSLACHPASTTHRQMSAEEQLQAGVKPETMRLSIGIEHVDDIIADLDQALEAATAGSR